MRSIVLAHCYFLLSLTVFCGLAHAEESTTYDDSILLWHNTDTGKLYYWLLNAQGELATAMAGTSGLVSDTQVLPEGWQIEREMQFDGETILFVRNIESGMVGFWRIGSDGTLVTGTLEVVSNDLTISAADWSLVGAVVVGEAPLLFWQKGDSTELRVWRLTEYCALIDTVEASGWGEVAPDEEVRSPWRALTVSVKNDEPYVWWRNLDNGRVSYWKLDAEGLFLESTEGANWGWVNGDEPLSSAWSFVDVMTINDIQTLCWRNTESGQVVYWPLDDDNSLQSSASGSDWGYVSNTALSAEWTSAGGFYLYDMPALLWFNQSTGKAVIWLLNDSDQLDSWNWVYSNSVSSQWELLHMDQ